jgi:hypothetical protein
MKMEFWSTSFAAPKPSDMNLLAELVGNYPPMPLVTQRKRFILFLPNPTASAPASSPATPVRVCLAVLEPRRRLGFGRRPSPSSLPTGRRPPYPLTAVHPILRPPSSLWPAAPRPRPATLGRVDPTRRSPPTCCQSSSTSARRHPPPSAAIHLRPCLTTTAGR